MSSAVLACEDCEEFQSDEIQIVFCTGCNYNQCIQCWGKKAPHKKGKLGPGGIPHDKVNPYIVENLKSCLAAPETKEEQERLHLEDEDTTWFGVAESPTGEHVFQDLGRYASIMSRSIQDSGQTRYPKIVSFIGETGAGKSTLIKLLIELEKPAGTDDLSAPIVGKGSSIVPTSADVHLYADPQSLLTPGPILYADCEGMRGGDRDPLALSVVKDALKDRPGMRRGPIESIRPIKKVVHTTKRIIRWIKNDGPDYEKRARREYAVTEMYPRILYSFSDAIVFVLRNVKVLDHVVEQLLSWAHAHSDGTVNQPSLPHAIIVLNACDDELPSDEWDEATSTASLLSSAAADLEQNPMFKRYVDRFRQRNQHVIDMKELLNCYYSDVTVLRIPGKNNYKLLDRQRQRLYKIIHGGCERSHRIKKQCKMLSNSDDLQIYLQSAFDHFSQSLDTPFDFVAASVKNHPVPIDFSDHLLHLADVVSKASGKTKTADVFSQLTTIASSCILLDAIRKKLLGVPAQWFDHNHSGQISVPGRSSSVGMRKNIGLSYRELCSRAIDEYQATRAPCEFKYKSQISRNEYQCIKKGRAHYQEHRLARSTALATDMPLGTFQSDFVHREFDWEGRVLWKLKEMESNVQNQDHELARQLAAAQHSSFLLSFLKMMDTESSCISHTTCFCCLMELPEHKLPCGHVICTPCARDFGRVVDRTKLVIDDCPLHQDQQWMGTKLLATLNPLFSGARILSLDGGGMKGVVELLTLEAIETELGPGLKIQQFFDLIVGTSTGGIIALGLGVNEWSVSECRKAFVNFIKLAFTKRPGGDLPFFKHFNLFVNQSRYQTKTMETALRNAFGERLLFGQDRDQFRFNNKVAVTATSPTGEKSILMANYNRRSKAKTEYLFDRESDPINELKTWEAARCTSAAPGYFKPYTVDRRDWRLRQFIDGGLKLNNPIKAAYTEYQLLFHDQSPDVVDIILSIGCGRNSTAEAKTSLTRQKQKVSRLHTMLRLVEYQFEVNTEADKIWTDFLAGSSSLPSWQRDRFRRINPDLGYGPPLLDAVEEIENLEIQAKRILDTDLLPLIRSTTLDLIASSFYFQRAPQRWSESDGRVKCPGTIRCRFPNDSDEIKSIGEFLRKRGSQPCFVIHDFGNPASHRQQIEINCNDLITRKNFDLGAVEIFTRGGDTKTLICLSISDLEARPQLVPISGFPRALLQKDFKTSLLVEHD